MPTLKINLLDGMDHPLTFGRPHVLPEEMELLHEEPIAGPSREKLDAGRASMIGDGPSAYHKAVRIAERHGWRELWHRENECRVRFKQGKDTYLDLWYTKMTVGTVLTHPKKGRTQLFRRNADWLMVESLLKNPRHHTSEGYYANKTI